jgi:hypothetical protein
MVEVIQNIWIFLIFLDGLKLSCEKLMFKNSLFSDFEVEIKTLFSRINQDQN